MTNAFDMGKALVKEKVVCALLEAGNVTFYNGSEGFGSNVNVADFAPKAELFDRVCELPNWDEICGRVVFLNPAELQEILDDDIAYRAQLAA